jgi:hypothetical protein
MQLITCSKCGSTMRKVRPSLILINDQVVQPDDRDHPKVRTCTNPNCPGNIHSQHKTDCTIQDKNADKLAFLGLR